MVQALYQWQLTGHNIGQIDAQFREEHAGAKTDMDYFADALHGVAAHTAELEAALLPHLSRDVEEINPVERAILRLAAWELVHRLDIPYRVAINEAINLAKRFGAEQSHKLINGVLDKLARETRAAEVAADDQRQA